MMSQYFWGFRTCPGLLAFAIVALSLFSLNGCKSEECKDCTQCYSIGAKKQRTDSLFTPIRCKGPIVDVKFQKFYDHGGHYTFLTIDPIVEFGFVGSRMKTRMMNFYSEDEVVVGMRRGTSDRIVVGDTFLKFDGRFDFAILKLGGDTIFAELNITNRVRGNDWRYIRKNGQICHEVW